MGPAHKLLLYLIFSEQVGSIIKTRLLVKLIKPYPQLRSCMYVTFNFVADKDRSFNPDSELGVDCYCTIIFQN